MDEWFQAILRVHMFMYVCVWLHASHLSAYCTVMFIVDVIVISPLQNCHFIRAFPSYCSYVWFPPLNVYRGCGHPNIKVEHTNRTETMGLPFFFACLAQGIHPVCPWVIYTYISHCCWLNSMKAPFFPRLPQVKIHVSQAVEPVRPRLLGYC